MKITFVSNYINHHQIPFCNAMDKRTEGGFTFVQTCEMEEQRVRMGWDESDVPSYVRYYYKESEACKKLIADSDVVIFGGCDDESYIADRLRAGKPVLRYSERLYKTGQWKAVSPRGLYKKYMDHTRYRKAPVYLLCAGGYVASDYHIVKAYSNKMLCWGYFPEVKHYDVDKLLAQKGYGEKKCLYLLWAGRMIDWKHPELAIEIARHLKDKGICFHLDMVGAGDLFDSVKELAQQYHLEDAVSFVGFCNPKKVREYMEKADIYLFTSDRQEGWGAVANEAMNSGCALVADHMIGAIPFLAKNGENAIVYEDKNIPQLLQRVELLAKDESLRKRLGRAAYNTVTEVWNAENAAESLMNFIRSTVLLGKPLTERGDMKNLVPCAPAPVLSERAGRRLAQSESKI